MPVSQTLTASRNVSWAYPLTYDYQGGELPLDGARVATQWRLYGGAAGDALLTLPSIDWTDELLSGTAGEDDEVRRLTLLPVVTPAQLQALPPGPEAGDPLTMLYDIRITYADGMSEILSSGSIVLLPGVTLV